MILVTGATGFIGRHIVKALRIRYPREKIIALYYPDNEQNRLISRDLSCEKALSVNLAERRELCKIPMDFTVLVHAAAFVPKSRVEYNSDMNWKVNVEGARNLAFFCARNKNLRQIVLSSSMSVYGDRGGVLSESVAPQPADLYGFSKWMSEEIFKFTVRNSGVMLAILRYASVYGAGQNGFTVLPRFIKGCRAGDVIQLYDEGRRYQDFIHVDDVARANVAAIVKRASGVLNVATGKRTSMKQLALLVADVFRAKSPRIVNARKKEMGVSQVLDARRMKRLLGLVPLSLEAGLRSYGDHAYA